MTNDEQYVNTFLDNKQRLSSESFYNEYGYFRDQVHDGCASGSLSRKTAFGFFPMSLYLFAISKNYETCPQTHRTNSFGGGFTDQLS